MLVNGEPLIQRCPVVGNFEETGWNMQCPMSNEWSRQSTVNNLCNYNQYNGYSDIPVECYNRYYYVQGNVQQYCSRMTYNAPIVTQANLPCQQRPEWDYNSMCYNVDGQACQYTNVVDLEDFM